jgi:hypothetical protein
MLMVSPPAGAAPRSAEAGCERLSQQGHRLSVLARPCCRAAIETQGIGLFLAVALRLARRPRLRECCTRISGRAPLQQQLASHIEQRRVDAASRRLAIALRAVEPVLRGIGLARLDREQRLASGRFGDEPLLETRRECKHLVEGAMA